MPGGPWTFGARYNLARTYETLGDITRARELLNEDDDSPQKHGNWLRAKLLRKWNQPSADSEDAASSASAPPSEDAPEGEDSSEGASTPQSESEADSG